MAYDHRGAHSTMTHFESATKGAIDAFPDAKQVTVGVPFMEDLWYLVIGKVMKI